jgi:DNA-binding CsgD family transcriptional regulator
MSDLNIKENTLKFHNKNLYSKLGISSRKQLLSIAAQLK